MLRAGQVGSRYMGATDATLELIKSLHAAIELPIDRKLKRPLGPAADKAQLRTLEAWRSGQTLNAIKANLAAAEALYLRDGEPSFDQLLSGPAGRADLAAAIRKQFAAVQQAAARLREPLDQALAKPDQRQAAMRLVEQGEKLKRMIAEDLTEALDVPLGFNSLDGD
jgi:predicted lipoprotein